MCTFVRLSPVYIILGPNIVLMCCFGGSYVIRHSCQGLKVRNNWDLSPERLDMPRIYIYTYMYIWDLNEVIACC